MKSLVDKMNGEIKVESVPDKGSKFVVSIPFDVAKERRTYGYYDAGNGWI